MAVSYSYPFKSRFEIRWISEIQTIYYQGHKRGIVPSQDDPKFRSFFNTVATLMTQCLQDMALYTIDEYTNLLITPPDSIKNYEHCGKRKIAGRPSRIALSLNSIGLIFLKPKNSPSNSLQKNRSTIFVAILCSFKHARSWSVESKSFASRTYELYSNQAKNNKKKFKLVFVRLKTIMCCF